MPANAGTNFGLNQTQQSHLTVGKCQPESTHTQVTTKEKS